MRFSDLPSDLESEILCRVPATSLVPLQTTCKRWYVLFKDSEFVEKNFVKGKAETKVMLKQHGSDFSVSINMHGIHNGFDPYIEFTRKLKIGRSVKVPSEHGSFNISEICHCNGLLLCTTNHSSKFVVWNPCTAEIRWINNIPTPHQKYFLGYENNNKSCHSYKILGFNNYYDVRVPSTQFGIYEFNTASWRILDDVTRDWGIESSGVTLKGNAYCLARKKEEPCLTFILQFDFTTETFERLSLPFQSEDDDQSVFLSVIKEEKLALLHLDDIWVMKIWVTNSKIDDAKDLSWSHLFEVDLDKFKTFDSIDIENKISFLVDEENKMVVYTDNDESDKNRTRIHVVGEDIYEEVYTWTRRRTSFNNPLLISYVPSLVRILATRSHPGDKRQR